VAAGVVEDGLSVLLVRGRQHGQSPAWGLPGGVVEPGELATDGLVREVREETGLTVGGPFTLAYVTQFEWSQTRDLWTAVVFAITDWTGELRPQDPDGHVDEARFFPRDQAIERLTALPFRVMREPAIEFLAQRSPPGTWWGYRQAGDDHVPL
jgi:8-oxo-dGTP diphosphatase